MSEKKILKALLNVKSSSLEELSQQLSYPKEQLGEYLDFLESRGLITKKRRPYSPQYEYSPKRLEYLYQCSAIAPEYLQKKLMEKIMWISSLIAAIASVITLLVA